MGCMSIFQSQMRLSLALRQYEPTETLGAVAKTKVQEPFQMPTKA